MCNKEDGNKKVFGFDELLEYYKTENLNLIPLKHGDKKPVVEWKDYQTRRITKEEIDKFFRDGTHNIGVVCGAISDYLFVLDFDEPDLFDRYFEKKDGLVYVKTGRGFHVYFKADKPVKTLKCFDADGRELLTLKGEASYVVAPPSLHSNGKLYEFMKRGEIPRLSGDARQHVKERAEAIGLTAPKESIDIETILKGVPEGGRDTALTHIIHFLRRAGTDKKDVLSISEKWNLKNKPPLEQTKLKEKVDYHFKIAEPYKYFFSLDPGQWYITDELTLETKKADAKSAAIARQHGEQEPTLDEVLEMEDDTCDVEIINYTVLKKVVNGTPQNFYVETQLVNGEIEMALTHSRAIPVQTAPSLDFCTCDYNSLHEIYIELRKEITDYIAFANDSIAPDLIALGSVASYFREVFYTFPYYDYISSEPEAGKTTAMKVQTFTSFYGTIASSITEALLFREIDGSHCFYGLDNIERLFASPKDYASIIDWLLSSYSRDIPCKRLEKTDEGYEVRYFDGYGIKAFTHIRDFPFGLRALRSRCIQIVMQNAPPSKFYPTAEKFTAIRDKLYKARLYEFDVVKETYEELIASNVLRGRTGDLYYPLLAIAKLVNEELYNNILKYATTDEVERKELDSWNVVLIQVLLKNELFGSQSAKDIRDPYEEALITAGLLKDTTLNARTVTMRLKKMGFQREDKKTDHIVWYLIDRKTVILKAREYNIIDENEEEDNAYVNTLPLDTFSTLSPSCDCDRKPLEGSMETGKEDKGSTVEIDSHAEGEEAKGDKWYKVEKRGVLPQDITSGIHVQKTKKHSDGIPVSELFANCESRPEEEGI